MVSDTQWIGPWSVPKANCLTSMSAYEKMLQSTNFEVMSCNEITTQTWRGFCHFLRTYTGQIELADGLESSIIAYLLNYLKKPII